ATDGVVSVGGSSQGQIETVYDRDWFAVHLEAGQHYFFTLYGDRTPSGLADPYLELYDGSGAYLTYNDDGDNVGLDSVLGYTPDLTGTYYLVAQAYDIETGAYTLGVSRVDDNPFASTATDGVVSVGGSSQGQIETVYDRDWFAVHLEAGQHYFFTLYGDGTPSGLADPYLELYDGSGAYLTYNDDGDNVGLDSVLGYTPDLTGTYYLVAQAYDIETGAYTLGVSRVDDNPFASTATDGVVSVGGSSQGQIETVYDRDWFAVHLEAGQHYFFTLYGDGTPSGLADPYLELYDGSGAYLTYNDDGDNVGLDSVLGYTPDLTGTYYLVAQAYDIETGAYTLGVRQDDDYPFASTATDGVVSVGGSSQGLIETVYDRDWFAVHLEAGQHYFFTLYGDGTPSGLADPYLELYDGSGTYLTYNDDGDNVGLDSVLGYTPDTTGTYYLVAQAYDTETGAYTLGVRQDDDYPFASTATDGVVSVGGSSQGQI